MTANSPKNSPSVKIARIRSVPSGVSLWILIVPVENGLAFAIPPPPYALRHHVQVRFGEVPEQRDVRQQSLDGHRSSSREARRRITGRRAGGDAGDCTEP